MVVRLKVVGRTRRIRQNKTRLQHHAPQFCQEEDVSERWKTGGEGNGSEK